MTEAEILAEWEARYGELSAEQRVWFLEKGGHVKRLVKVPDDVVREAISDRRPLEEIEALAMGRRSQRRSSPGVRVEDCHPSECGSVTIRRPGRPEQVINLGFCDSCGSRLTPEGRCGCSR